MLIPPRPAPRPTFASALRGTPAMHNGHVVLANASSVETSASPSLDSDGAGFKTHGVGSVKEVNGINGVNGVNSVKGVQRETEGDLIDL